MSTQQRDQITDIFKWVLWGSLSVSSFLVANTYRDTQSEIKTISEKLQSVEARIIRLEYELKLK